MSQPEGSWRLLRQNAPFLRFWLGETASLLGTQVTRLALPLTAVLILHADAAQMGYLAALELAPYLLLSLPIGLWLDRRGNRRHKMMAADLARVLLLLTLPVLYRLGLLGWTPLYLVAGLVGLAEVVFSLAYASIVTTVVPPRQYLVASTLLQGSRALTQFVGPALAGALIQILSAPVALVADAASFVVSALGLATIHPAEPAGAPTAPHDITEGLRFVWTAAPVRLILLGLSTINLFNYMFSALYVLYVTRFLHIHPGTLGVIFSLGAGGAIVGALTASVIGRRMGSGNALALGTALFTTPLMLVPFASGAHLLTLGMLTLAQVISGFGVMVLDINFGSLSLALVPDAVRGRTAGAFTLINYGVRPIGALLGGWLPSIVGLRGTLWIASVCAVSGVLWLLSPMVRRLQEPQGELAQSQAPS